MPKNALLVYFHGFNSAPDPTSEKIDAVTRLGQSLGYRVETPVGRYHRLLADQPEAALSFQSGETLSTLLPAHDHVVFAGSSMGGWLALRLGALLGVDGRLLINPAVQPLHSLKQHVSETMTNFVTGEAYRLPKDFFEHIEAFDKRARANENHRISTLVLLDMGDELLDSQYTRQYCQDWAEVQAFPGGSHRFEHIADARGLMKRWLQALRGCRQPSGSC